MRLSLLCNLTHLPGEQGLGVGGLAESKGSTHASVCFRPVVALQCVQLRRHHLHQRKGHTLAPLHLGNRSCIQQCCCTRGTSLPTVHHHLHLPFLRRAA